MSPMPPMPWCEADRPAEFPLRPGGACRISAGRDVAGLGLSTETIR